MNNTIAIGSIWREDDKRMHRRVRVVADCCGPHPVKRAAAYEQIAVRIGAIAIMTIDGNDMPAGRVTFAQPERFGKSGGYTLEKPA